MQYDWKPGGSGRSQQNEVRHVVCADLDDVDMVCHLVYVARFQHLGRRRQPALVARMLE